jgi:3-methyladenine DNA glycosylase AlkD
MTAKQILDELKPLGSESYRRVMFKHGVKEPYFGVKISDLQKIVKRIKRNYQLALDLYDTGNYDAMYLAGLIADDARMTRRDLQHWADNAYCRGLSGATVPWVAAGSPHGWEMAMKWIDSEKELIACAGWATFACIVSIKADPQLDQPALKQLMQRVQKTLSNAPDLVRYQMNGFIIAMGCYVVPLSKTALEIAEKIGPVTADLGDTSCAVPSASDYIRKVETRGTIEKKRKTAKC